VIYNKTKVGVFLFKQCISLPEAAMLTLWQNLEALMTRSGQGHCRMKFLVFKL